MGVLFALNLGILFTGSSPTQKYLKYNDVRGMAVKYQNLLYTLNFAQQNAVIDILNQAIPFAGVTSEPTQPSDIQQMIVYQFEGKPDLILTPIAYINEQLVFTSPAWNPKGYFMEVSGGQLKTLLSQTYDHPLRTP